MNVSINPSYYCNFRCNFCYLTEMQLSDRKTLSIARTADLLRSIAAYDAIDLIEIYGGEVGLLPVWYLNDLIDLCLLFAPNVSIITNLSNIHESFLRPDVTLSVSYDFNAREKSDIVLQNILKLSRTCSIITLVTPLLMNMSPSSIISTYNNISSITDVELKPYSSNQSNQIQITNYEFDEYVKQWLELRDSMRFNFINEELIKSTLSKQRNMYSNDHVYITPSGSLGVLSFDSQGHEYFESLNDIEEYQAWCLREKQQVASNAVCNKCDYVGHCLTEHARPFLHLEQNTCDGHLGLIKWYNSRG